MAPVGNGTVPRRTYGLSLGLSWKGLDFSVFFQGLGGFHSVYLGNMATETALEGSYFNWHRHAWTEERWKNGEKITYPALGTSNNTNHQRNDFFIQDKTFLRLKNMEIGYTIPAHLLRRAGITNLRVFERSESGHLVAAAGRSPRSGAFEPDALPADPDVQHRCKPFFLTRGIPRL